MMLKDRAVRVNLPPMITAKFWTVGRCRVSLEEPALSGRPVSHWGLTELTQEVIKRGIVDSISRSQVGSFLKTQRDQAPQDPGLAQP